MQSCSTFGFGYNLGHALSLVALPFFVQPPKTLSCAFHSHHEPVNLTQPLAVARPSHSNPITGHTDVLSLLPYKEILPVSQRGLTSSRDFPLVHTPEAHCRTADSTIEH